MKAVKSRNISTMQGVNGEILEVMNHELITIALGLDSSLQLRGGVNVLVETLIDELSQDFRIVLVSTDAAGVPPASIHPKIAGHVHWRGAQTSRAEARRVAGELAAKSVRLVHLHGGVFGFGMRFFGHCPFRELSRLGIRTVWTNHTWIALLAEFCGPKKPLWFKLGFFPFAWLSRVMQLKALDRLIAVSDFALKKEQTFYFPARKRMRLIYHSRSSESTAVSAGARTKTVVAVGHFAPRKGQLIAVKAFARIAAEFPDWNLILLGPSQDAEYGRQVEVAVSLPELAGRVSILGQRADAKDFMRTAGIFLQPSFWEGLPIALQEAMFFGTPCVASRCNGNVELVKNGETGLLVDVGDDAAMAVALATMIRDEALRTKYGRAAREFVERMGMTIEAMAQKHRALYRELLAPEYRKS